MKQSLRNHPFRYAFLGLMLWLTLLTIGGGYIAQRQRSEKARLAAESDLNLCVGQNKLKAAIQGVVLDSASVRKRLGIGKGKPVSVALVRQEAQKTAAPGAYAKLLLQFLNRFAQTPCDHLPSHALGR